MARPRIEQAGAVVFRRKGQGVRILVISSRRTRGRWLFPKGHIDDGERASAAALREASEEAGVVGRIIRPLAPAIEFRHAGEDYRVRYFLVEWTGETAAEDERECLWLTPDQARQTLSGADARELLDVALEALENRKSPRNPRMHERDAHPRKPGI